MISDGAIYEEVSRRANPDAHAKIDSVLDALFKEKVMDCPFDQWPNVPQENKEQQS